MRTYVIAHDFAGVECYAKGFVGEPGQIGLGYGSDLREAILFEDNLVFLFIVMYGDKSCVAREVDFVDGNRFLDG